MHFFLDAYKLILAALIVLAVLVHAVAVRAEEPHDHAQLGSAGEFYSRWQRPKGNFSGVIHRGASCCNRTDCSPVIATEMRDGRMFARFEREPTVWYRVDPSIIESNQEDPRETPDHRSHGCIIGGQVACFVEGGGT